jgi:hypothetical protein
MLRKIDWKGCAPEVDKCNAIQHRRNINKTKMSNKREKIIAYGMAVSKLETKLQWLVRELNKHREQDKADGIKYKLAFDSLRKKSGSVKRKGRHRERDKIIKKLNL